jgi:ribosomal protein S18 acetylase RimI-like enzyme
MEIKKTKNKEELKNVMDKIYEEYDNEKNVDIDYEEYYYMVEDDGKIIGGITGWRAFNEIYIEELCINKNYREKGLGKKLIEIVEKEINNINLVTNEFSNAIIFIKNVDL